MTGTAICSSAANRRDTTSSGDCSSGKRRRTRQGLLRGATGSRRLSADRLEELHHAIDGETGVGRRTEDLNNRTVLVLNLKQPSLLGLRDVIAGRTGRYGRGHACR